MPGSQPTAHFTIQQFDFMLNNTDLGHVAFDGRFTQILPQGLAQGLLVQAYCLTQPQQRSSSGRQIARLTRFEKSPLCSDKIRDIHLSFQYDDKTGKSENEASSSLFPGVEKVRLLTPLWPVLPR